MLQASLRVVGGKHDGELVPMASHRFLIGREEDCQLRPNNDLVSRHHCAFTIDDYSVRLRDLGSTNGTLVNGERLRGETTLERGDRVTIGKLEFELEIAAAAAGESPAAPVQSPLLQGETAELSSDETTYDLPAVPAGSETTVLNPSEVPPEAPAEAATTQPAAETVSTQPAAPPEQQPAPQAQPGYYPQQPVAYPQQPMGYPQPGYYVQQPMGYPQPPGYYPQYGYPPQAMPGQPIPAQFQPPAEAPAAEPQADESDSTPDVQLPDPSQTGATDNAAASGGNASASSEEEKNPSEHAADIIRQHMNRRPIIDE